MKKYKDKNEHYLEDKYIRDDELIKINGEKGEYKEITLEAFLNKGYRTLFLKKENNLSGIQKLRLRQILRQFDKHNYMKESRIVKERFCEALDKLDISEIREIKDECLESKHYRINEFGRTLRNWDKQLYNYCLLSTKEFKFTNAFTESINNQCKVAKRVSHGFKYKDSYKRKLSSRFLYNTS